MSRGRFSFILPICLAVVLGGGWCVRPFACPVMAGTAAFVPAAVAMPADCPMASSTHCERKPCHATPSERDGAPKNESQLSISQCMSCCFFSAESTVFLGLDSAKTLRIDPIFSGFIPFLQTASAAGPVAAPSVTHTANRAGSTLLGLRCALNL